LNKQQLQSARLQRWSQNNNARLTLEDASGWLREIGLCSLAPQMPASHPAPTLLEALHGKPMLATTMEERATLNTLLARMVQAKSAVPLLLSGPVSEQPDFVASLDALPMLYALRGDRNWRTPPSLTGQRKVSNLALHVWQSIEKDGPQTVSSLQAGLTGDLTGAALLRALCELWGQLRVAPLLQVDDAGTPVGAAWEILARRHARQVSIGSAMGQPEALSGLLGFYLSAVLAASDEEIVACFAPLASQSKVREMLHSLLAMRQLERVPSEGAMLLYLKDSLPEELLATPVLAVPVPSAPAPESSMPRSRPQSPPRVWQDRPVRQMQAGSAPAPRGEGFVRRGPKPQFAPRREDGSEGSARPPRREFPARKDAPQRASGARGGHDREDRARGGKPSGGWKRPERRTESGSEGRSARWSGEERKQRPGARSDARPGARSDARPGARTGARPDVRSSPRPFAQRPSGPDAPREAGSERPVRPASRPPRKEFGPRQQRPAYGASSRTPGAFGPKKFGDKKFGPKKFGDKKFAGGAGASGGKKFGGDRRERPDRDRQAARPPRRAEGVGPEQREQRGPGGKDMRQRGGAPQWKRAAGAQDRPERREKRSYGDRPSGPRRDGGARGAGRNDARGGAERGSDRGPARRPEAGAKRFARPGTGKPRAEKAGFKKSGFGKPSFRKPGTGRPAAGGRSTGPRRTEGAARPPRTRPAFVKRKKPSDGE
jgi:23S rRNA pseudouridine2605 synthase